MILVINVSNQLQLKRKCLKNKKRNKKLKLIQQWKPTVFVNNDEEETKNNIEELV